MLSRVLKQNELFEMSNYKRWICMFSPSISSTMVGKKTIEQNLNVLLKYESIKKCKFVGYLKNESLSFGMPKFYLKKLNNVLFLYSHLLYFFLNLWNITLKLFKKTTILYQWNFLLMFKFFKNINSRKIGVL